MKHDYRMTHAEAAAGTLVGAGTPRRLRATLPPATGLDWNSMMWPSLLAGEPFSKLFKTFELVEKFIVEARRRLVRGDA
jgi:hypothetical protein